MPTPALCSDTTKSCKTVSPTTGYDCIEPTAGEVNFKLEESDYTTDVTDDQIAPGSYEFTYEECITGTSVCADTTVTVTIADPCDPPTSLTTMSTPDQTPFIGDNNLAVVHDALVSEPNYCVITYTYSYLPALSNAG